MKRSCLIVLFPCILAVSAFAQKAPRIFDNFDRTQGVQVYVKPAPPVIKAVNKKATKKKRGSKWVVAVEDELNRKTTSTIKKTAKTGAVLAVTDGLAHSENLTAFGGKKLVMGSSPHLKGFTTGDPVYDSYIVDSSRRYGIDPLLIYAQMHQESSFKLRATSHKGASGLMQLMPATARRFGVTKIYDPKQNIDAGVRYMRWLLDTFHGDVVLALAGYNAGEGAVMKYGGNVPPYRETKEYVRRITSRYYSISNPSYIQSARRTSSTLAANLEQKDSRPLTTYEPSPLAVRTADGKMMLVNQ
ncbi:MAG: lytic transglycosylase domain-containing protein [Pyrinomonadaceae bacterium]